MERQRIKSLKTNSSVRRLRLSKTPFAITDIALSSKFLQTLASYKTDVPYSRFSNVKLEKEVLVSSKCGDPKIRLQEYEKTNDSFHSHGVHSRIKTTRKMYQS